MTTPFDLGKAFRLGMAFAAGLRARLGLALDESWITIHPNGKFDAQGKKLKGQPILIDDNGVVIGGVGGKLNGTPLTVKAQPKKTYRKNKPTSQGEKPKKEKEQILPKKLPHYGEILGEQSYKEIRESIRKGDKTAVSLYDKIENDIKFDSLSSPKSFYNHYNEAITLNLDRDKKGGSWSMPWRTLMHEVGHAIDHKCGAGLDYATSLNRGFADAIDRDVDAYVKKVQTELTKRVKENPTPAEERSMIMGSLLNRKGVVPKSRVFNEVASRLNNLFLENPLSAAAICDIFNGASKGKIYTRVGHSTNYWKRQIDGAAKEGFANLFSLALQDPSRLADVEKYLPTAVPEFRKLLKTLDGSLVV